MISRHSAFWRYTVFQIPSWILVAIGGWWIHRSFEVPAWLAPCALIAWVIKDYALYPFLRFAYETDERPQIERLIGTCGTTVGSLEPRGYVRVRGELWRAQTRLTDTIAEGEAVEVISVDGMSLIVRVTPKTN